MLEAAHLTLPQYLAVAAVVLLGATSQGTVGFGLNLIAAPVVGVFAPQLLPTTMIVIGVPLSIAIALAERDHIDWTGVGWTTLGRLPGSALGAALVAVVSARALGGIVGIIVLVACGLSLVTVHHVITPANSTAAGVASGFMDTAAATGGPPLALLYQHRPGPEIRSTFAVAFPVGTAVSLAALTMTGEVHGWQLFAAVTFLPSLALGYLLGRRLIRRVDGAALRSAVVALAALGGLAALIKSIAGP